MTQPDVQAWSGAVQRELDGLQRNTDLRFADLSAHLDKLLTLTEYAADKRSLDLRFDNLAERAHDSERDLESVKSEVKESFNLLRKEIMTERTAREKQHSDFLAEKKSQFRWLVSMVMIPIGIAIVTLIMSKK
jgi:hypothetical protein